jgi:hypothetical protein
MVSEVPLGSGLVEFPIGRQLVLPILTLSFTHILSSGVRPKQVYSVSKGEYQRRLKEAHQAGQPLL